MNPQTLEQFKETYSRLLVYDLGQRLGVEQTHTALLDCDAKRLIHIASCLALGPPTQDEGQEAEWKRWAYDVATRLAEARVGSDTGYRRAAGIILARLGNFPGRTYLLETLGGGQCNERYPPALAIEVLSREAENTVEFRGLGAQTLTDFQVRLVESLRRSHSVSVSAPTSAGKSFILALDIINALADGTAKIVVYLVPTRALIRQVMTDLLARLREARMPEIAVSAAPVSLDQEQLSTGVVYVLTQERLMSLLYSPDGGVKIDRIYVDEAQEIGDEDRGMVLHSAVREVLRRFPSTRVCFASPLTANPGYLFSEFEVTEAGEFFTERQGPVSQMVIILDEVKGKPKAIDVSVVTPLGPRPVGQITTRVNFRGVKQRLAQTAVALTRADESTIVYANGAGEAMDVALHISDLVQESVTDKEVLDLVAFVRTHIHSRYALVDTLPKGVAFHYGRMPHLIRSQVEDLLRRRKLKYVVCTSTLLQGVNLPAKNIFILSPRKGNGRPMHSPDFWNLAGRAGRLRETFHGNIWCIQPKTWDENPLEGEQLSEMKSAFRVSLEDHEVREALVAVLDNTAPLNTVKHSGQVEQVFGKVFTEFTCENADVSQSPYAANADKLRLADIDAKCKAVQQRLSVPIEVCKRNSMISPLNLDDLWKVFQRGPIEGFVPLDPIQPGALERMRFIFRTIDEIFIRSGNESHKYFASLAYFWVWGRPLKDLITDYLEYNKVADDRSETNKAIRHFLDTLEQTVRFTYVKYLKAYIDALGAFLAQHKAIQQEAIVPLHLFIEFGARDKVLVMLMSLGLSRTTSIFVRDAVTRAPDISRAECWTRLNQLPLRVLDIPEVCKTEIRQLTGQP